MTLQSFEIDDHRALSRVECNRIPKLTVIAGPNGVGKSTLLYQLHQAIRRYQPSSPNRDTSACTINCERETESVYFSPHRVPGNNSQFNRGDLLGDRKTRYRGLLSDDVSLPSTSRNLPTQRNPRGPDATAFRGVGRRMAEFTEERKSLAVQIIENGGAPSEGDLPNVEEPLKSLVNRVVPGITLEGVVEENDNYRLVFENRTGEEVQFEDLSSGEIDIIVMLFFVAEQQIESNLGEYSEKYDGSTDQDLVVLIDGPESYLHPYLQLQFIEFLSDYVNSMKNIQILLVTHSEIILNNTPSENLWYLLYPDMADENQLKSAENIDIHLLEDILGEMGTSALAAGRPLLLVEGGSDREVLTRLYPEIQDTMTVLPMEGKQNIVRIENTLDKLVSNFLESGIQLYAIVDGDRDPTEISSTYIYSLPVSEIENILLQPEALFQTVQTLASEEKLRRLNIESERDIENILNNIISRDNIINEEIRLHINETLEFEVGLGASEEITKQSVLERFDEAVESNRDRIQERYDSIVEEVQQASADNELSKFKGKHVLREFSSEFDLKTDSVRLLTAENIQKENLHPDSIDNIISDIQEDIEL